MNVPGPSMDFFLTFTFVLFVMPLLMHFAPQLGVLDSPNERKPHKGEIPMVGGLALFAGFALVLVSRYPQNSRLLVMLAGAGLLVAAGFVDDRGGLSATIRFVVQIAACALMAFGAGVMLHDFGELLRPATLQLGWLAVPVTLFCMVGVTNALNMIDGMDGLSGALALVCLGALALAVVVAGSELAAAPEIPALAGGICAYLLFNLRLPWRRHSLAFLGDSGTLLLGFVLGWLLVERSQGVERVIAPVTALWLLAMPLMDAVFVMIKRRRAGLPMTGADREHVHHAFLRSGWSVNATLVALVTLSAVLAGAGLGLEWVGVPEYLSYALFLGMCGAYYVFMNWVWKKRRFLGRAVE